MEVRTLGLEDKVDELNHLVKENVTSKNFMIKKKMQELWISVERPNLQITGIGEET